MAQYFTAANRSIILGNGSLLGPNKPIPNGALTVKDLRKKIRDGWIVEKHGTSTEDDVTLKDPVPMKDHEFDRGGQHTNPNEAFDLIEGNSDNSAHAAEVTQIDSIWVLDPAKLQGMGFDELKAMVGERDINQEIDLDGFADEGEVVEFLSQDFDKSMRTEEED